MKNFWVNNQEAIIATFSAIVGWFLGIVTRPWIEKYFTVKPRLNFTTTFRSHQAYIADDRKIYTKLETNIEVQNHSDNDAHGFIVKNITLIDNEFATIDFERFGSPKFIDRSNPCYFNFIIRVELKQLRGRYEHFEWSIPALRKALPIECVLEYEYKNSLGRVSQKKLPIIIHANSEIGEGNWVGWI